VAAAIRADIDGHLPVVFSVDLGVLFVKADPAASLLCMMQSCWWRQCVARKVPCACMGRKLLAFGIFKKFHAVMLIAKYASFIVFVAFSYCNVTLSTSSAASSSIRAATSSHSYLFQAIIYNDPELLSHVLPCLLRKSVRKWAPASVSPNERDLCRNQGLTYSFRKSSTKGFIERHCRVHQLQNRFT
jgi:hypothetical protein